MKQNIFLLTLLLSSIVVKSQSKPFFKQTTLAFEISKNDTINKKQFVTYLDSLRNVITTENNIINAVSASKSESNKSHSIIEVDTDRLYISADIDKKGDTIGKMIYVYDDKKNRTENYQIRNGDTINGQKRIYNKDGNYTKLYNKHREGHKYFLSMEWEYDSKGNMSQCKSYNALGDLIGFDKYENVYKDKQITTTTLSYTNGKGFVKISKKIKIDNITTTYFYRNSIAYNYGIKLTQIDGGMRIEEKDQKGNLKELKQFDDKNNLIAYVKCEEVQIE